MSIKRRLWNMCPKECTYLQSKLGDSTASYALFGADWTIGAYTGMDYIYNGIIDTRESTGYLSIPQKMMLQHE